MHSEQIACPECEICDLQKKLAACGNVLCACLRQCFLRGNNVQHATDTVTVGFARGGIRLVCRREQRNCRLLLPLCCSYVGVGGPNLVRNLVAERIDLRQRCRLFGPGLRDFMFAAATVEDSPLQ
jgi:hypothetical protein